MGKSIAFNTMRDFRMDRNAYPSTLRSFINQGQAKQIVKNCPVIEIDDEEYLLKNGLFFGDEITKAHDPDMVLVQMDKRKVLLINGDEAAANSAEPDDLKGVSNITISFACIAQMLNLREDEIRILLGSGKIRLLDYIGDSRKKPSESVMKTAQIIIEKFINTNPSKVRRELARIRGGGFGYTLLRDPGDYGCVWHRPAMAVFKYKNDFYVMGQDDGSYFMCLLPKMPKRTKTLTVSQALAALKPKGVIGKYMRQGEWFFVPVGNSNNVPKESACELFHDNCSSVILPIDDKTSNKHMIISEQFRLCKGTLYVKNFSVTHDEHPELNGDGWFKVLKNTARKSVSQQGVD